MIDRNKLRSLFYAERKKCKRFSKFEDSIRKNGRIKKNKLFFFLRKKKVRKGRGSRFFSSWLLRSR